MSENKEQGELTNYLLRSFLALRDVFGYALPGGVFLALAEHSGRLPLAAWLAGRVHTAWALAALLVGAAYVAGTVLVDLVKIPLELLRPANKGKRGAVLKERLGLGPRTDTPEADPLLLQARHPQLFLEVERRGILTLFRIGLAGAFLAGAGLNWGHPVPCAVLGLLGLFMLFNALAADEHVAAYRKSAQEAARRLP